MPMYGPVMSEELAILRCVERQQDARRNWQIEQALAETRHAARRERGHGQLLRRAAWRVAWRLTRLAGADNGPYTVQERATLVDARGMTHMVCPDEIDLVLLRCTDRDAA
ncbi:MAG: hypothetical protein ACYDAR_13080 [Thermomicrobiales bacterium]